jgi:hypothetical protein
MEDKNNLEPIEGQHCPVCGEHIYAGSFFCIKCGEKIEGADLSRDEPKDRRQEQEPVSPKSKQKQATTPDFDRNRLRIVAVVLGGLGVLLVAIIVVLFAFTRQGKALLAALAGGEDEATPVVKSSSTPVVQISSTPAFTATSPSVSTPTPLPQPTEMDTPLPPTEPPAPAAQKIDGGEITIDYDGYTSLTLQNDSGKDICYVYFMPSEYEEQTDNLLDTLGLPLKNGESKTTEMFYPGLYDLSIFSCTGEITVFGDAVNIDGSTTLTIDDSIVQQDRYVTVTLINETSTTVCAVWVGPPYSEWIGEVLQGEKLPAGSTTTVDLPVRMWAIQARDCSERAVGSSYGLNISRDTIWHITPDSP